MATRRSGYDEAQAGLEDMPLIDPPNLPHVIKSPWSFEFIDELLAHDTIRIEAAILPVRDLRDAATSRAIQERRAIHEHVDWMTWGDDVWETWCHTPGGILYSLSAIDQARILAVGFHQVVEKLIARDVPVHFVAFPRMIDEPDHLFKALQPILPEGVGEALAGEAHASIAKADLVRVRSRGRPGGSVAGPSEVEFDCRAMQMELRRMRDALARREADVAGREAEIAMLRLRMIDATGRDADVVDSGEIHAPRPMGWRGRVRRHLRRA